MNDDDRPISLDRFRAQKKLEDRRVEEDDSASASRLGPSIPKLLRQLRRLSATNDVHLPSLNMEGRPSRELSLSHLKRINEELALIRIIAELASAQGSLNELFSLRLLRRVNHLLRIFELPRDPSLKTGLKVVKNDDRSESSEVPQFSPE